LSRGIGANSAEEAGLEAVSDDASGTAETPAHLKAQAASFVQWPLDCVPQSGSGGQQSACADVE
jgi:hypothetical protein